MVDSTITGFGLTDRKLNHLTVYIQCLASKRIAGMSSFKDPGGSTSDDELARAVAQVIPRMDGVRQTRGRIGADAVTCLGLVEDLVLRGGPPGRCPSCPEGVRTGAP